MRFRLSPFLPRIALAILLMTGSAPPGALDTELPDLGNSAGGLISPKRER